MKYATALNKLRRLADEIADPAAAAMPAALRAVDVAGGNPLLARFRPGAVLLWADAETGNARMAAVPGEDGDPPGGLDKATETTSVMRAVETAVATYREFARGRLRFDVWIGVNSTVTALTGKVYGRWTRVKRDFVPHHRFATEDRVAVAMLRAAVVDGEAAVGPLLDFLSDRDEQWFEALRAASLGPDVTGPEELLAELDARPASGVSTHGYWLDRVVDPKNVWARADVGGTPEAVDEFPAATLDDCAALLERLVADRASRRADLGRARERAAGLVAALAAGGLTDVSVDPDPPPLSREVVVADRGTCILTVPADGPVLVYEFGTHPPVRRDDAQAVLLVLERYAPRLPGEAFMPPPANPPAGWTCEYQTAGGGGDWAGNNAVFPDRESARREGGARFRRWTACAGWRAVPSDCQPNYPAAVLIPTAA